MRKVIPILFSFFTLIKTVSGQQVIHACCDTFICLPGSPVNLSCYVDSGSQGSLLSILDDTYSQVVDLGFPFTFYGNTYTQCLLSTNVYISFGNLEDSLTYSPWPINNAIPSPLNPTNAVMGPWQDVDPAVPPYGSMGFGTFGTAPNRFFVFNFCSVPYYWCWDTLFTGQIVLFEGSNTIEMHLGAKRLCWDGSEWNNGAAIEGLQDATGTHATVIAGRNYPDQWTAFNDAYRFTPVNDTSYSYASIPYAPVPFAAGIPHWTDLAGNSVGDGYNITVNPQQTTSYIVTTASCGFSADTVTIVVGAIPAVYDTVNLSCQNANDGIAYVSPTDNSGPYTFVWTNASNDTLKISTGLSDSLTNLAPGSYTVHVTNAFGCTLTHTYVITAPVYNVAFSYTPGLVCDGSTVSLHDLSSGNIQSYAWDFGDGNTSTAQNPTHLYSGPGDYTVSLTIKLSPTCFATTTQQISVHPNIQVSVSFPSPPYCVGQELSFTDHSIGNPAQWNWIFGDGGTSDVQNPTHIYSSEGTYHIYVSITDSFCGSGGDSAVFDVYSVPNPQLRSDTVLCGGEIQLLDANAVGTSYLWSTGETASSITFVMPDTDATVWVKVDNNGCSGYDSVFFKNHCVMLLPSAFSPNGDGKNDFFRPLGSTIQDFDFIIFNRWGEQVFSKNSGDIHDGWDGTFDGKPQPVGVYVYYLTGKFISGETFSLHGSVTLIR